MSTAARPTRECMAATSSGMLVICTRLAATMPMRPPTTIIPSATSTRLVMARVVTMAMVMPTMPNTLPRLAESGCDRPFRDRMNRTLAVRYRIAV